MRVLIVSRHHHHQPAAFVREQAESLARIGCEIRYCGMDKGGIGGYRALYHQLQSAIRTFHPDIIHAHYGLCGLIAGLQRRIPVVTTYHGSDINDPRIRPISRMAMRLSARNIFVSRATMALVGMEEHPKTLLQPCGVDLPDGRDEVLAQANDWLSTILIPGQKHVLFASAFDNPVKDYPLASAAVGCLDHTQLVELKGFNRAQVTALMYASDALLLTSHMEGSPQVVKEALATGLPIVSVDVGDVRERIERPDGFTVGYVASSRKPEELAQLLSKAFLLGRTQGRQLLIKDGLTNDLIARRLCEMMAGLMAK